MPPTLYKSSILAYIIHCSQRLTISWKMSVEKKSEAVTM